ncbi:biliverdin-producing heme oxygenase [Salmonella enterica]|nr:biliverdin-producing heme oxygenase [Salmonella enterica]
MDESETLDKPLTRSQRLKALTHNSHERLDKRLMTGKPFADLERYGRFLQVQYRFHHGIDPLFLHDEIAVSVPDLRARRRLDLIKQDMRDVGIVHPLLPPIDDYLVDVPNALGWIYVAEGSNLGAAFLLKEASKLGLSERHGARHLAGAPEGRGLHWRTFTEALDRAHLDDAEEARVAEGAKQAFNRVRALVEDCFSG